MGVGLGVEKMSKKQFSEWGLPGVEIVGAPPIKIFKLSRISQLPYKVKISKTIFLTISYFLYTFPYFPMVRDSPLKG